MKITYLLLSTVVCALLGCCGEYGKSHAVDDRQSPRASLIQLRDSLQSIADSCPGEVGVAVITDRGDTMLVNNQTKYPMMSVFKLHQAIALCHLFETTGQSLDSVVTIHRSRLNLDTWSPMLTDHTGPLIDIPIRDLLTYTITLSDNNASNWIFDNLQSVDDADEFIASIIPRESFRMRYTEAEMTCDHSLAYKNCTSPLGAAILVNRLYNDSIIGKTDADFVRNTLDGCLTGTDRIVAPLKDREGITVGHKTGSGYRNSRGVLAAHNDVGFIRLPNGRHYTLAVFVKDFKGNEEDAAATIARISETVFSFLSEY